ncbi:MAG: DNA-directed RNA polymerase subunit omega [Nitrospirae bacterium CG_4_10_14_3_um_filter_44_29]|nr:DNA-directed RNA polymerase subunit omega [Nitrospirota bacterium]OIO31682.1 MAG: DNA-directed RNA polymerase subunit omega [Nitrospirae bacterium CG1_02_44_142]PIP69402.1 MAG: DNA-directed RNA polymerase subunit omega [Nitrospirae bacterium CG22_combo_CG10-13_8_21_14_all_44_11]PIV42499.1 MAG: DNA-directed RNA polymerase subunit omega [Nitrospirae bacterium CG02_land_8_20_14_3_00_44_33]PIV67196.1 MAG: DNA-directed RNA polymerase subunit omega [Nitrospirae bacterium CG01_land_8_20_14_3_00_44_
MDIISLPIELDMKKIDGRYRLVMIASQRAKELSLGVKPKIQTKSRRVTTIAIEEAVQGKLEFLIGEEAKKAEEDAKKFDYRRLLEEKRREATPEELTELEKDLKVYLHEKETVDKKALEELFSEKQEEGVKE